MINDLVAALAVLALASTAATMILKERMNNCAQCGHHAHEHAHTHCTVRYGAFGDTSFLETRQLNENCPCKGFQQ